MRHQVRVIERCARFRERMQQLHLRGVLSDGYMAASATPIIPVQRAPLILFSQEPRRILRWIQAKAEPQRRRLDSSTAGFGSKSDPIRSGPSGCPFVRSRRSHRPLPCCRSGGLGPHAATWVHLPKPPRHHAGTSTADMRSRTGRYERSHHGRRPSWRA